ncbi:MAG: phosphodiester glycosidase family protein [Aquificaceae bacterium]|nr:phosphodiester glycosidase family protein [Aquificaceae bacterium]
MPVGAFRKVGVYRFVLHFYDDYADGYKNHCFKPALEVNAINIFWPVVWIRGCYAGTDWFGVWVNMRSFRNLINPKGIKTVLLNPVSKTGNPDDDLPSVQKYIWDQIIASARSGNLKPFTKRAAVNGTFFNHNNYPYAPQGHVGTGNGWPGNDIQQHRWAFGITEDLNFVKERMIQTSQGLYTVPPKIKSNPFGLSGIGCLISDGSPIYDPNQTCQGYEYLDGKYARTLIAWTENSDHFFMIWADGGLFGRQRGWTWQEARDFLREGLPLYMQQRHFMNIRIHNGILLDGGSHSDIIFIGVLQPPTNINHLSDEEIKRIFRNLPYNIVEVHDIANKEIQEHLLYWRGVGYDRGNRSLVQVYILP